MASGEVGVSPSSPVDQLRRAPRDPPASREAWFESPHVTACRVFRAPPIDGTPFYMSFHLKPGSRAVLVTIEGFSRKRLRRPIRPVWYTALHHAASGKRFTWGFRGDPRDAEAERLSGWAVIVPSQQKNTHHKEPCPDRPTTPVPQRHRKTVAMYMDICLQQMPRDARWFDVSCYHSRTIEPRPPCDGTPFYIRFERNMEHKTTALYFAGVGRFQARPMPGTVWTSRAIAADTKEEFVLRVHKEEYDAEKGIFKGRAMLAPMTQCVLKAEAQRRKHADDDSSTLKRPRSLEEEEEEEEDMDEDGIVIIHESPPLKRVRFLEQSNDDDDDNDTFDYDEDEEDDDDTLPPRGPRSLEQNDGDDDADEEELGALDYDKEDNEDDDETEKEEEDNETEKEEEDDGIVLIPDVLPEDTLTEILSRLRQTPHLEPQTRCDIERLAEIARSAKVW